MKIIEDMESHLYCKVRYCNGVADILFTVIASHASSSECIPVYTGVYTVKSLIFEGVYFCCLYGIHPSSTKESEHY